MFSQLTLPCVCVQKDYVPAPGMTCVCVCASEMGASCWSQAGSVGLWAVVPAAGASGVPMSVAGGTTVALWI